MRRRAFLGLVLAAPTVAWVGLPTLTSAVGRTRPVPPTVRRLALSGIDRTAASSLRVRGSLPGSPSLLMAPRDTEGFSLLGVTWRPDPTVQVVAQVRTRTGGRWTDWTALDPQGEHRPDGGNDVAGALRDGTAPRWVGPSDGVQVRLDVLAGRPRDVGVELVDPGTSPADDRRAGPRAVAFADAARPTIITRAQWGADESIRRGNPSYNTTVKVGFVHHTASSNDYTPDQAAAMVRGIYAYHVKSNGWSDIGYNYLVDRYGRAYEGRAGGLDRFVIGAHTGGFNKDSFAVSLLGDFTTVPPSQATVGMTVKLLAWKLGSAYRDPKGTAVLTSAGGGTSKYPAGTNVTFDVVSGHRDAGSTSCPGNTTYARLPGIRDSVVAELGPAFADPMVNETDFALASPGPVTVTARTLDLMSWTATALDAKGTELRTVTGTEPSVDFSWDLTGADGRPVPAGTYAVRLTGVNGESRALTYSASVVVDAPLCRGTPIQRALCRARQRAARGTR